MELYTTCTKIANKSTCSLSHGNEFRTSIEGLNDAGMATPITVPFASPAWPEQTSSTLGKLAVDFHKLNGVLLPITAALLDSAISSGNPDNPGTCCVARGLPKATDHNPTSQENQRQFALTQ